MQLLLMKDLKLSEHFMLSEFACKNPSQKPARVLVDPKLVAALERFRALVGKPLSISSGYRTPQWNRSVGGSPRSQHLLGRAADIPLAVSDRDRILVFAVHAGFTGIGFYDGFIHLDVRETLQNREGRVFDLWDLRKKGSI